VTGSGLEYHCIDIPRSIQPMKDVMALIRLFKFFQKNTFDIVHSTTPKAGLLSALAGKMAGVPIRLHTWTGQQWVTMKGPKRFISRIADRLIGVLNTRCYADSHSQMRFLVQEGIVDKNKIAVIGENSLSGVDLKRFDPPKWSPEKKQKIRHELSISATSKVIIFVGRIAKDKGIQELIGAFETLLSRGYELDLVLVGPLDQERGGDATVSAAELRKYARVHLTGYTASPEYYLSIADIFCLPSYREGFGTVVIEAAAMGLPAVGTNINGLVDAIVDGETGILVPPRDESALMTAMQRLLDEPELLMKMGQNARRRCVQNFSSEIINRALAMEYERLLMESK
jgi:glycosyltransferase involved in cell wall biosynthesis